MNSKYEYLYYLDNGDSVSIRAEHSAELDNALKQIQELYPRGVRTQQVSQETQATEETKLCDEHGSEMKLNKNKNWYHREYKDGKTRFCNGINWGEWR